MALLSISASAIAAVDGAAAGGAAVGGAAVAGASSCPAMETAQAPVKENAVKEHLQNHYKFYGFVRNYMAYDSREAVAGTGDLFFYLPQGPQAQ